MILVMSQTRVCEAEAKMIVKARIHKKGSTDFKGAEVVFTQKLPNQLFFQQELA
jgi:hypothetical protein